ncbi:unnamed protein product [Coffea canephora]|uniref:DH200=94 genomic scaffold, scaffold_5210 n=1 Tax=Coffea canephora TaxID=49390 RepID=A0A068VPH1_COFCA|nr:unnamed protein product [Coffea canephora]
MVQLLTKISTLRSQTGKLTYSHTSTIFILLFYSLFFHILTKLTCVDVFDWSGLRSASTLRELQLRGLPHTESLPHQLQYLTTLTSLSLHNFGGIEVLPDWIGNLVSLETLKLWFCQKLQSLPPEAAMRRLVKLTSVEVSWCPLLRQRYTSQRGIYLEEEISRTVNKKGNDGTQTSVSCCFPSLLKKEKPGGMMVLKHKLLSPRTLFNLPPIY